ncbi:MAG TPA: HD domain-containing protein [Thermodesulfobacteriota bacterium]|nr:HD domain-containing protein [Thermodesulfobacteriota bacterium]
MKALANFLFETGMLKRTPRSGLQFLGSGSETVAEHSFRVIMITYTLAHMDSAVDENRALKMALVHDILESRTGDLNYVNKKYLTVDEEKAVQDVTGPLPFGPEMKELLREFRAKETPESLIVNDADQLELILMLKEYGDLGNKYSKDWISFALKRLRTAAARQLAETILTTDSTDWWFEEKDEWWVWGNKG